MTDRKRLTLMDVLSIFQAKGRVNDNPSPVEEFQKKSVAPDLAAVARMHNIERTAEANGHLIVAPPTRH